jgi:hypothetical protein
LTVNVTTAQPGAPVTVTLSNGLGGATDLLDLATTTAPDSDRSLGWTYVGSGVTTTTWTVNMPLTAGAYQFRYYPNNGFTRAATSATVTVIVPPPTLTVNVTTAQPGAAVTVTLTNGLGGATDWLDLAATTAPDSDRSLWWTYVGSGVTTATWTVNMPLTAGAYQFRYYPNNGFTRAATSATITVTVQTPQFEWKPGFDFPGGNGMDDTPQALTVYNLGTGAALYATGEFTQADGVAAKYVAKWDGSHWTALGSGLASTTRALGYALAGFNDGTGAALYVGGRFMTAGGIAANNIAKWNGTSWSPLATGTNGDVWALVGFNDGTGPALYAGGAFSSAGSVTAHYVAKWNGSTWADLGGGMNNTVEALAAYNDGTGLALYAGGNFTMAGNVNANSVAKWNGAGWVPLSTGLNGPVYTLTVFNDGTGSALYAGGQFTLAGGVAVNNVAKWNGTTWSPVGPASGWDSWVGALTVFDNGTGPALYAGGLFTTAAGVSAMKVAQWTGSTWSPLGNWTSDGIYALAPFNDGTGPALYAGGEFTSIGAVSSSRIAKWARAGF